MASRNKFYKNLNATATLKLLCNFLRGGEGGIRTHGTLLYSSFQDCPIKPLSYLSINILLFYFNILKILV